MHLDRFLAAIANVSTQNNADCGIDAQEDAGKEAEGEVTTGEAASRDAALLRSGMASDFRSLLTPSWRASQMLLPAREDPRDRGTSEQKV